MPWGRRGQVKPGGWGVPCQVQPGGYPGRVPPGQVRMGGYSGRVCPPGRVPPPARSGWGGTQLGQQKEYSLHGRRYASCVHAGGLSCLLNNIICFGHKKGLDIREIIILTFIKSQFRRLGVQDNIKSYVYFCPDCWLWRNRFSLANDFSLKKGKCSCWINNLLKHCA